MSLGSRNAQTQCVPDSWIHQIARAPLLWEDHTSDLCQPNIVFQGHGGPLRCLVHRLESNITIVCVMLRHIVFRSDAVLLHKTRGRSSYTKHIIDLFRIICIMRCNKRLNPLREASLQRFSTGLHSTGQQQSIIYLLD